MALLEILCTMVRSSSSVDSRLMIKDNLAEPGTITSSFTKFGKRTVNSWFSSIVLGLFVMTTFCFIPFTHFEFLNRLYGFSLCSNVSLLFNITLILLNYKNNFVYKNAESVVAERSSLPDASSGVSSRMWVRIPAVTLVSLSKTLNHNCFSPPRG